MTLTSPADVFYNTDSSSNTLRSTSFFEITQPPFIQAQENFGGYNMSNTGFLYSQNNTAQTVAVGGTINMGTNVRRKGCVCGTSNPYATTNGTITTLSSRGRCSEYFQVSASFVVTPTAAGTVTINAVQDGVNVGAVGTATVAAAATTVTIPIVYGVRLNSGVTSSNITYVLTGAASTVNNVSQVVERIV